jgi:hypothetical protein
MSTTANNAESRMNQALLALEELQLSPKKVSEITGIPESNLSVKRKKYCRPSDKDLIAIEKIFEMRWVDGGYVFADPTALVQRINHKLYGKDAEFFDTHWWMYIWTNEGIGRLVLHIENRQSVSIINLPFDDGRQKDYTGHFAMDASKRFVILNLHDKITGEKNLHIKMAVGYGTKPFFCLGQYSNTHESGHLEAGNVLFMLETQMSPTEMHAAILRKGDTAYDSLPHPIRLYFAHKHLNRISIPRNVIQSQHSFEAWMERKHSEDRGEVTEDGR